MAIQRNGVREWIFQRVSNVAIFAYAVFYLSMILTMEPLNFENWSAAHSGLGFKIYSTITLIIVMVNAILAGWQIGTDYTQKVPVKGFSAFFHTFYTVMTVLFLGFGLFIFWG